MVKTTIKTLLAINDFEAFKAALAKEFPGKRLTPGIIGEELFSHLRRLAQNVNSETITEYTDPRRKRGDF